MDHWLCDSNIISEEMRPKPDRHVRAWLQQRESLYLSVITIDEITFGLQQRGMLQRLRWFETFLKSRCVVLDIDENIARRAGKLRADLAKRGQTREQADMLIAATAWAHGLSLATRNTKDFADCGVPVFNPFTNE